jgi:hypothetical protein
MQSAKSHLPHVPIFTPPITVTSKDGQFESERCRSLVSASVPSPRKTTARRACSHRTPSQLATAAATKSTPTTTDPTPVIVQKRHRGKGVRSILGHRTGYPRRGRSPCSITWTERRRGVRTHQLEMTLPALGLSGMLETIEARLAQAHAGQLGQV